MSEFKLQGRQINAAPSEPSCRYAPTLEDNGDWHGPALYTRRKGV